MTLTRPLRALRTHAKQSDQLAHTTTRKQQHQYQRRRNKLAHFTVIKDGGQQLYIATKFDTFSYELIDGVQVETVITAESKVQNMLQAGESYLVGAYPITQFKIVDGLPVELTASEQEERLPPKKPNAKKMFYNLTANLSAAGTPTIDALPNAENWTQVDAVNAINQAAGRARFRNVSQGTLVNEEYQLTANQVQAWRTAGSPANDVPPTLSSWATASGMSTELAAQNIEATAAAYNSALESIRDTRLNGNAAVNAASSDFATVAQTYIDTLDAL